MAILPQAAASGKQPLSGARFRQRKISVKIPLAIYNQKDISTADVNNELEHSQVHHLNLAGTGQQPRDQIETGVDKNEEDEVHLQQVINAAQKALLGSDKKKDDKMDLSAYIPTPDASRIWPEASKYYNDPTFKEPDTYIKFSATVEDTVGVEYNLDEEDETFFNNVLVKKTAKVPCTELEFELVCDRFEKTIEEKQPFLAMDTSNILSYKELAAHIVEECNSLHKNSPYMQTGSHLKYMNSSALKERLSSELDYKPFTTLFDKVTLDQNPTLPRPIPALLDLFGEIIYGHWRTRKIERKGRPINPSLKFEDPNANEKDNDNDPYVCFRRREFRQARKTRRADTLGAERIRLLQKSVHRARDLIMSVCKRELMKLDTYESEHRIFQLRSEAKNLKRVMGVKGDDHLFFPHKRKKVIKPKEVVEDDRDKKREKRAREAREAAGVSQREKIVSQEVANSSTQPYIKLPPSKIPDMDLVTVLLVLKEKNETIKRAVTEKLRKRKEQDRGFINATDDPYQPFFNISTNTDGSQELSHVPYLSIAATHMHQVNTTNYISDSLKKLLEDGKRPLPGTKTLRGSNGELIPSTAFPHLLTLLQEQFNKRSGLGYIGQLLANIESNNFSAYSNGYGLQQETVDEETKVSDPIFRLRKRMGRQGRIFVDRRGLHRPLDFQKDGTSSEGVPSMYDSVSDISRRVESRWKFDNDLTEHEIGVETPFSLDPSRLNCISDDTQLIRFGSMLLLKSYDLLRESVHQRQTLVQQARMRALQQQQLANKSSSNSSSSASSATPDRRKLDDDKKAGLPLLVSQTQNLKAKMQTKTLYTSARPNGAVAKPVAER